MAQKIQVVSYASDGTETERKLQRMFAQTASTTLEHTFEAPEDEPDLPKLTIRIPLFDSQPIVMIQDSKHALKTARNNLFSGAKFLVLGNHATYYQQVRDIAFEDHSPLYHRDVEKLDRQDDNAATRLFSASTIQYISNHHSDSLFLIVYLFIFGELIGALERHIRNRHKE